jgi:hypothetical protein
MTETNTTFTSVFNESFEAALNKMIESKVAAVGQPMTSDYILDLIDQRILVSIMEDSVFEEKLYFMVKKAIKEVIAAC